MASRSGITVRASDIVIQTSAFIVQTSATGRQLWGDIESSDEEFAEEVIYIDGAAANLGAETPSIGTITRSTFRATPVYVKEMANMVQKTFMCHSGDTMARLRG